MRSPHAGCDSSYNVSAEGEGIEMLDQALSRSSDEVMIEAANIIEHNLEFMEKVEMNNDVERVQRAQWQQRCAIEKELPEALVTDLESEPKCEPGNFDKVIIRKDKKGICCVFRGKIGIHYSDSCAQFEEVEERNAYLNSIDAASVVW
ncbi:hypothetical protein GCK32_011472 [Trichostrongylus colubriformis]|uniref:Uncharacterized protein n=1 Tax=Trichostrongylus colubriformis TaxID=6319 RepID=A0AAN8FBP5_TRICO